MLTLIERNVYRRRSPLWGAATTFGRENYYKLCTSLVYILYYTSKCRVWWQAPCLLEFARVCAPRLSSQVVRNFDGCCKRADVVESRRVFFQGGGLPLVRHSLDSVFTTKLCAFIQTPIKRVYNILCAHKSKFILTF